MQGRGGGAGGNSTNWGEEVRLKIYEEGEGASKSIPPYFRRFEAFGNPEHPSIFKRRYKRNHVCFATPSKPTAEPPPQPPPLELTRIGVAPQAGCSGQCQATSRVTVTDREIVVAAVGPYHDPSAARAPPLITHAKKCGIAKFLAEWYELDTVKFLGWARGKEVQDRVRGCYERDYFAMDPEELAVMLLLDGCLLLFAVFLLRTSVCEDQRPAALARDADAKRTDFIYLSADISLHMKQTRLDMLMLENQIPFFVLAELHTRLKGTLFKDIDHSIQELALSCFDNIHPSRFRPQREMRDAHGGALAAPPVNGDFPPVVHHLLHLFHWSRVPRGKHKVDFSSIVPKEPEPHLPSATELRESLTRFKQTDPGGYSLDIAFQREMLGMRGMMSIPALCIHSYSDCVFRSLIAFEQNHIRCGLGVTAYSICMARLLQSEGDARVLRKKGILVHTQKTDKEMVDFFRGLRDEYGDTCMPEDLLTLCKDVAAHQQSRAGKAVKRVVQQCFPKQTVTFFVIVGTVISVATLVNTVHSMYRYYHPTAAYTHP